MTALLLNPALSRLLRDQTLAKFRRLRQSFRSPRKLALALGALILALVWLGNVLVSILFRQPYPIQTLRDGVLLTLMGYSLWHLLKVAWKRPEEAIAWSAAEREMICGGPFSRQQALTYRLTSVMTATLFKALCVSLLLLPDLPHWSAGFLGIALALAFVELLKMSLEIAAHRFSRRAYFTLRMGVFSTIGAFGLSAFIATVSAAASMGDAAPLSTLQFLSRLFFSAIELRQTWPGQLWQAPLIPFMHVITAPSLLSLELCGWFLLALSLVGVMMGLVFWIDRRSLGSVIRAERASYCPSRSSREVTSKAADRGRGKLPAVPRLRGIGPLAWRQMVGAFQQRFSMLAALAAPALLAAIPLSQSIDPINTFLQVAGGLVFYSFLLLPAALKFDFRRDYDRLYAFKTLPITPLATVVGQLATPVLLTSMFQLVVLAGAVIVRPVPLIYLLTAALLLPPLNALIFAIENFIFLLRPYRLTQEGIEVFFRTILVFTAKGIFYALTLVAFLVWSSLANLLSRWMGNTLGVVVNDRLIFILGVMVAVSAAAAVFIKLLVRAYRRYDPTLDA